MVAYLRMKDDLGQVEAGRADSLVIIINGARYIYYLNPFFASG
jgi:hypothetical protein